MRRGRGAGISFNASHDVPESVANHCQESSVFCGNRYAIERRGLEKKSTSARTHDASDMGRGSTTEWVTSLQAWGVSALNNGRWKRLEETRRRLPRVIALGLGSPRIHDHRTLNSEWEAGGGG